MSMTLTDSDIQFMAARVRRLCQAFEYPIPDDRDDEFIVGVAGSLIGGLLVKAELIVRDAERYRWIRDHRIGVKWCELYSGGPALDEAVDSTMKSLPPATTAKAQLEKTGGYEEPDPIERLRFFCAQAMRGQDWLDVEPFFDAVIAERRSLSVRLEIHPEHKWDGIACRDVTISMQDARIAELETERDALAAELAELEGQEPVAWVYNWQAPEGLVKDWVETNRDEIPEGATNIRPLFARQVPAEPVNVRLLDALKRAKSALVSFKFVPEHANCWEESDEEDLAAIDGAIAAADAQQERLLQDMHDAGREIDRVMAEATPKAARLTDEEIASLLAASDKNSPRVPSFFMTEPHKFARAIETAAIRKNGFPTDGGDAA